MLRVVEEGEIYIVCEIFLHGGFQDQEFRV